MNILEVRDVRKYFSGQKAVDGISFDIKRGSIFGLLGPNGAGKTTLIRMITGIFYQDSGDILFDGRPFNPESDVAGIGYMPEERGLYKKMKIGEQVVYLARLKGLDKKDAETKAKEWFTKFGMESWWHKKTEDLSKGMGQKLQFVSTILHQPGLIILDEPFSGLDPVNANLIKDEIFKLAEAGSTIIFSTHRMEQVEEICDHIVLINHGKKILDGHVQQVKMDFRKNLFEISFEGEISDVTANLFTIKEQRPGQIIVQINKTSDTNTILEYLISKKIRIKGFREILPSLNEIFISLVEGTGTARKFINH